MWTKQLISFIIWFQLTPRYHWGDIQHDNRHQNISSHWLEMRRLKTSKSQLATHDQGVTWKPLGDTRQSMAFVPDFGPRARLHLRLSSLIGPRFTFACYTISWILLPYLSPLVTLSLTAHHTGTFTSRNVTMIFPCMLLESAGKFPPSRLCIGFVFVSVLFDSIMHWILMRMTWKLNERLSKSSHSLGYSAYKARESGFYWWEYYIDVLLKSGRINMESIFESTHKNPLGKGERRTGDLCEGISTSTWEACPVLVLVTCDLWVALNFFH